MLARTYGQAAVDSSLLCEESRARIHELPEALVHDIWNRREYDHKFLETVRGEPVLVLQTGQPNRDAGPDFLDARIKIGRTEWIGDVEIHRTSSEWLQHRHDRDARYNRVILHVVLVADLWTGRLQRKDTTLLPEIALSGFLRRPLRQLLVQLHRSNGTALPCEHAWPRIPQSLTGSFVREMAEVRLSRRAVEVQTEFDRSGNLDQVVYARVLAALGYSKNQEPMHELAHRVPLAELHGCADRIDAEALLMGTAALIPSPEEVEGDRDSVAYVDMLRRRYRSIARRADRPAMNRTQWTFFRLRPSNFPPIRIAQAAALVADGFLGHDQPGARLLGIIERSDSPLKTLRQIMAVTMNPFWLSHVRLERPLRGSPTSLGTGRIDHILLNAILPVLDFQALRSGRAEIRQQIRRICRELPAENDEITRRYTDLGIPHNSAETTQGIHEMHGSLCIRHGCLRCQIGRFILSG